MTEPTYDIRDAIIAQMKIRITGLRIELYDALTTAYGARANWPESALRLLEDSTNG